MTPFRGFSAGAEIAGKLFEFKFFQEYFAQRKLLRCLRLDLLSSHRAAINLVFKVVGYLAAQPVRPFQKKLFAFPYQVGVYTPTRGFRFL